MTTRTPSQVHAERIARDAARIAADLARHGPNAIAAAERRLIRWECARCGDPQETAAAPKNHADGRAYCPPCLDHVRGVERESALAPNIPAPEAPPAEEEAIMTATAERPKSIQTSAPRPCGCGGRGMHKATCALRAKAGPVSVEHVTPEAAPKRPGPAYKCGVCERVFASASGLNGHKRVHTQAKSKAAQKRSAPAEPAAIVTPVAEKSTPPRVLPDLRVIVVRVRDGACEVECATPEDAAAFCRAVAGGR